MITLLETDCKMALHATEKAFGAPFAMMQSMTEL